MNEVGKLGIIHQYCLHMDTPDLFDWFLEETGLTFTQVMDQYVELNLKYDLGLKVRTDEGWTDIPLT
ncbi:hypothetical protein D3C75_135800 [compost metagenome]